MKERRETILQPGTSVSAGCMAVEAKWGNWIDKALADSWLLELMRSAGWESAGEFAANVAAEGVGIGRKRVMSILESGCSRSVQDFRSRLQM